MPPKRYAGCDHKLTTSSSLPRIVAHITRAAEACAKVLLFPTQRQTFEELLLSLCASLREKHADLAICLSKLQFLGVFEDPFAVEQPVSISLSKSNAAPKRKSKTSSSKEGSSSSEDEGSTPPASKTRATGSEAPAGGRHKGDAVEALQDHPCGLYELTADNLKLRCRVCNKDIKTTKQDLNHIRHAENTHHIPWKDLTTSQQTMAVAKLLQEAAKGKTRAKSLFYKKQ